MIVRAQKSEIIPAGIWLYFKRGITFGQFGRAHPYVWSTTANQPKTRDGKLCNIVWILNILVSYVYTGFVVARCVQKNLDTTASLGEQIYTRFTVVYYAFPTLFHTAFLTKRASILGLSVQAIKNMNWIEDNLEVGSKGLMKRCQFFMAYIFYGFNSISVFVTVYAFLAPDSPEMISSVLVDRSVTTRIACGLFQGYIEYTFHSQCFLIIFLFFGCLFPSWAHLKEIRTWTAMDFERRPDRFIRSYSSIRILIKMASDVFLSFVIPISKFMLISLIVFCTYSFARLDQFVAISLGTMGLILTIFLVVFFGTLAEVHELSENIRMELQQRGLYDRRTWYGKRLQCQPPIMFWMSSSYFVDKMLVLSAHHNQHDTPVRN